MTACAHYKKCGNPDGAHVVYFEDKGCKVRIRQVTIGTDMKIPHSLKNESLAAFELEWIEPALKDGNILLGHFQLTPKDGK